MGMKRARQIKRTPNNRRIVCWMKSVIKSLMISLRRRDTLRKEALVELLISLEDYSWMMMTTNNLNHKKREKRNVGLSLMKMLWWKSAIWVMGAGRIIILLQRSKLDSTDLQRLLLVLTMTHQLMFGVLLAPFLKWSPVIFCLNQEKETTTTRMMIISHKWWSFWEECPRTWHLQVRTQRSSSTVKDIWRESVDLITGHSRRFLWRSTESRMRKHKRFQTF